MLDLSCTVQEQNDSLALIFTDNTGDDTVEGGWGYDTNLDVTDIDGNTHTLELKLTIKTLSATTEYDYIDLYDEFGPFTTVDDLVFTIPMTMLLVDDVLPSGVDATTTITEGIITVEYIVDRDSQGGTEATYTFDMLSYNQSKIKVYDKLRQISAIYNAYDSRSKEIDDSLLMYSILKGIEASAYVALEDDLLEELDTLATLYENGSNYTWK
jgi:hypothetical protein